MIANIYGKKSNFITQLIGAPWAVSIGLMIFSVVIIFNQFLRPSMTPRQWNIPDVQELHYVDGALLKRLGARSPYLLHLTSGDEIRLWCDTYFPRPFNNCIEDNGIDLRSLIGRTVRVGYFTANDFVGDRHILMELSVGSKSVIPYSQRKKILEGIKSIEDRDKRNSLQFCIAAYLILLGFFVHIIRSKISISCKNSRAKEPQS